MSKTKSKSNDKVIINNISFKNRIKFFRYKALENVEDNKQFSVLSLFSRFTPISAFYPHFSVLSSFQRFIPISAFYPHFSVLSPFEFPFFSFRFSNSVSAFYPDRASAVTFCFFQALASSVISTYTSALKRNLLVLYIK